MLLDSDFCVNKWNLEVEMANQYPSRLKNSRTQSQDLLETDNDDTTSVLKPSREEKELELARDVSLHDLEEDISFRDAIQAIEDEELAKALNQSNYVNTEEMQLSQVLEESAKQAYNQEDCYDGEYFAAIEEIQLEQALQDSYDLADVPDFFGGDLDTQNLYENDLLDPETFTKSAESEYTMSMPPSATSSGDCFDHKSSYDNVNNDDDEVDIYTSEADSHATEEDIVRNPRWQHLNEFQAAALNRNDYISTCNLDTNDFSNEELYPQVAVPVRRPSIETHISDCNLQSLSRQNSLEESATSIKDNFLGELDGATSSLSAIKLNTFDDTDSNISALSNMATAADSLATNMATNTNLSYFMEPFPFGGDGNPTNWEVLPKDQNDSTLEAQQCNKIGLSTRCEEYESICKEMQGAKLHVLSIERVQNHVLLDHYKHQMKHLFDHRQDPGFKLNERYLYHGTTAPIEQICEEGLDMRLSRRGHFGNGTYFSDNPLKCVPYSRDGPSQTDACLLKCRVLLGDIKIYPDGKSDKNLKREPEKENPQGFWKRYDSVQGRPKDYNEFVVYQNSRVLVEYIITYKEMKATSNSTKQWKLLTRQASEQRPEMDNTVSLSGSVQDANSPNSDDDDGSKYSSINSVNSSDSFVSANEVEPSNAAPVQPKAVVRDEVQSASQLYKELDKFNLSASDREKLKKDFERTYGNHITASQKPNQVTPCSTQSLNQVMKQEMPSGGNKETCDEIPSGDNEDNCVEQVLSSLIVSFMEITNTENVGVARFYIQRSNMDIGKAISAYFEEH